MGKALKSCFCALCTLFFVISSVLIWRLRTFRPEVVLEFREDGKEVNFPTTNFGRSGVVNTSTARNRFEQMSNNFYLAAQRCKVVYSCRSSFVSRVSFCEAGQKPLILVKIVDGELYIGMKGQNKYVKECVKRNSRGDNSVKFRILDPVDRGKRFLVVIEHVISEIMKENDRNVLKRVQSFTLGLDIYDVPMIGPTSHYVTKFIGAPFTGSAKYAGDITIAFTKLGYGLSKRSGKGIIFYDEIYEHLVSLNLTSFEERRTQLLFSGAVKDTGVGFQYGRRNFDAMAKTNNPHFVSNSVPPYLTFAEQAEYKYLLSLSGAGAWTFYRAYAFLTGSLMFCQDAPQELWYYSYFEPMVHYIPVQEDLSDIQERFYWAQENPTEAEYIAKKGRLLAIEIFHPENILREFRRQIVKGILVENNGNLKDERGCYDERIEFCKGPVVCKDCIPSKVKRRKANPI